MYSTAPQIIDFIQYDRAIHSYKQKYRPLYLRIHCLDQSDTILIFELLLVVPHDYVISFSVNKFYRKPAMHKSWILIIPFLGFPIAVLRHTDYRISDTWLKLAGTEGLNVLANRSWTNDCIAIVILIASLERVNLSCSKILELLKYKDNGFGK